MSRVSSAILYKVYLLMGVFGLLACGILYRVVSLQFIERSKWIERSEKERIYPRKDVATRGSILASDGSALATSQPSFKLSIDPKALNQHYKEDKNQFSLELDSLSRFLALTFGEGERDAKYYKGLILNSIGHNDRHLYLVKRALNYSEFKKAKAWPILRNSRYKGGLLGEKVPNRRFYPFKNLARISVGIMRDDTIPLKGIEFAFNKELRGQDGELIVQKIAGGIEIPLEDLASDNAVDGSDVVMTLDVMLQDIAESSLLRSLERTNAKYGVALVMEVKTGEIKAMVNLTRDTEGEYYEGYNYAMAEQIEPGSTFKLASFMAALEDNAVNLEDTIATGKGKVMFYDKTMSDHEAHGTITYRQGFEFSSNVATSTMIHSYYKDNPMKFINHLERFGLLKTVNTQIPGEPLPKIVRPDDKKYWNLTTLPWLSIGYNIRMTPLQILTFYNAIANDGRMIEPRIVREIRKGLKVEKELKGSVLNASVCKSKTLREIRSMLEGVVDHGTASNIRSDAYAIAGKTGTAQKVKDGRYQQIYSASFCGYFPADAPKYSCYILIDEPQINVFGASAAAPVFREIADYLFSTDLEMGRDIAKLPRAQYPSYPVNPVVNQENAENIYDRLSISTPAEAESRFVASKRTGGQVMFQPVRIRQGLMPEVRGMSARDAINMLETLPDETQQKLKLVSIQDKALTASNLYPAKDIPSGTYKFQKTEVKTYAVTLLLMMNPNASKEMIAYLAQIRKDILKNVTTLQAEGHAKWKSVYYQNTEIRWPYYYFGD